MKKEEFTEAIKGLVEVYINNADLYGKEAQIRVNPVLLTVDLETAAQRNDELACSQEAIENAAYAHDAAQYEAMDYQASQNPDFYPVRGLVKEEAGILKPDPEAIEGVAAEYFGKA